MTPPPRPDPALVHIGSPAPGFRLAFVSIPRFLEACLRQPVGAAFRTAPPLRFAADDFHDTFLGPDEIATLNRFKALKKQVEWMAGRYAAKQLARDGLADRPPLNAIRVAYLPKGAPYLTHAPGWCLSITHSGDHAAACLGFRPAAALGIDLECIRPASRRLLLRTAFSDREAADLQHRDDVTLFLRWTAKEAFLKSIGMGFHESLKQVEILNGTIWHRQRSLPHLHLHSRCPFPGYAFSIVIT